MAFNITENPKNEYFLAICRRKEHSFLTIGFYTPTETHILCSTGKVLANHEKISSGEVSKNAVLCKMLYSPVEAIIWSERDENLNLITNKEIEYKAYHIEEEQYKQFLAFLKTHPHLEKKRQFKVRYHDPKTNCIVETDLLKKEIDEYISTPNCPYTQTTSKDQYLSAANTCRDFAIEKTRLFSYQKQLGNGVSRGFFTHLPLKAKMTSYFVNKENLFYILPLPPNAFNIDKKSQRYTVLKKLYMRLDQMIMKENNNPITKEKFDELKALYQTLAGKNNAPIPDLIQTLQDWEKDHQSLIKTHRNAYRFHWMTKIANCFKTSTEKLFDEFHSTLRY